MNGEADEARLYIGTSWSRVVRSYSRFSVVSQPQSFYFVLARKPSYALSLGSVLVRYLVRLSYDMDTSPVNAQRKVDIQYMKLACYFGARWPFLL